MPFGTCQNWCFGQFYRSKIEKTLMSGSCHIPSVEIVVEPGIFVFFWFSAEKSFGGNLHFVFFLVRFLFSWKFKRKQRFQVQQQFQHVEYDMKQTLITFETFVPKWWFVKGCPFKFEDVFCTCYIYQHLWQNWLWIPIHQMKHFFLSFKSYEKHAEMLL